MTSPAVSARPPRAYHLPVASATLAINERVAQLWSEGCEVFHLGFGESRFPPPSSVLEALASGAEAGYAPVAGHQDLRQAIAEFHGPRLGRDLSPDQIVVGPGSKALLYGVLLALGRPVILPTPSWVSYEPQARMCGLPVHRMPGVPERGYRWGIDDLATALADADANAGTPGGGAGAGCLLINSPNNPTGTMFEPDFVAELAAYCAQSDVIVISDEIYAEIGHGSVAHRSVSSLLGQQTIVTTGLSKHLSLGGWRLGVAILPDGDEEVRADVLSVASEIWSSASGPIQQAATVAYRGGDQIDGHITDCTALHRARTRRLWAGVSAAGLRCPEPDGGFYLMPDFDRYREPLARLGVTTSRQLAEALLDRCAIATLPGEAFGLAPTTLAVRMASSFIDLENDGDGGALLDGWRGADDEQAFVDVSHPRLDRAVDRLGQFVADLR